MNKDYSIIIPTYNNRHKYLNRILDYFSFFNLKIIVVDSSEKSFQNKNNYNIDYIHSPNYRYNLKLHLAVEKVETPYVLMCADDDFIVPNALDNCVNFLEENEDYSSAQGLTIDIVNKNKIISYPNSISSIKLDINKETPSERIEQLLVPYVAPLSYAVHRTENLKSVFALPLKEINIGASTLLMELFLAIISIINGKHKVLSVFYSAREIIPYKPANNNLKTVLAQNLYKKTYQSFIDILAKSLAEKEEIPEDQAKKHLLEVFNSYLQSWNDNSINSYISYPIKSLGMKKIFDNIPFIKTIKQFYSNMVWKIINNKKKQELYNSVKFTKGIKGYPYYDENAIQDWKVIKSFIKKHGTTKQLYQPS